MTEVTTTTNSPGTARFRTLRLAIGWTVSAILILSGLIGLRLADGWLNEIATAYLQIIVGLVLLPPVLRIIRKHWRFAQPTYAPVVFFLLFGALAVAISALLMPSLDEQRRLQRTAMARAEELLSQGKPTSAKFALRKFSERRDEDNALGALLIRIEESEQARDVARGPAAANSSPGAVSEAPQDPASLYLERIETYWLPEARALPDNPPEDYEAFGKLLTQIDGLVLIIEDGARLTLSEEQNAVREQLIDVLSKKQVTLLPALRRRYTEALDAQLFRRDVRVSGQGKTLRIVGRPFVKNANVQDMQVALSPVINRLRFTRVEYRWNARIGDSLVYELSPPTDAVVARWDGTQFLSPVS